MRRVFGVVLETKDPVTCKNPVCGKPVPRSRNGTNRVQRGPDGKPYQWYCSRDCCDDYLSASRRRRFDRLRRAILVRRQRNALQAFLAETRLKTDAQGMVKAKDLARAVYEYSRDQHKRGYMAGYNAHRRKVGLL